MVLYEADITRLMAIKEFIDSHLQDDLTIAVLSLQFSVSNCKLQRQFKQYFGQPVHNYVLVSRMELAKQLLVKKGHIIADIALAVGYQDRTSFTRAYKRYHKQTPATALKNDQPVDRQGAFPPGSRL